MQTYLESSGLSVNEFKAQFQDRALDNVKSSLILEEVGKRESITE